MTHRASKIKNIKTISALRGDILSIDLGKAYDGTLKAWLRRDGNSQTYRDFDIVDNRYLVLSREATRDFYDSEDKLVQAVEGLWYFDVEFLATGEEEAETKTILTGRVRFSNDMTGAKGTKVFYLDDGGDNEDFMRKIMYDPDLIEADVFDIDNLKDSATYVKMTVEERNKLGALEPIDDSDYAKLSEDNEFTESQTIHKKVLLTNPTNSLVELYSNGVYLFKNLYNSLGTLLVSYYYGPNSFTAFDASSDPIDLGEIGGEWKELFLSSFANVLGVKTGEDDASKALFSDGSVDVAFKQDLAGTTSSGEKIWYGTEAELAAIDAGPGRVATTEYNVFEE